jgi:cysteinyl-tRNA synthetase
MARVDELAHLLYITKNLIKQIVNLGDEVGEISKLWQDSFLLAINDDLNIPSALALAWDAIKDKDLSDSEKYEGISSSFLVHNTVASIHVPPYFVKSSNLSKSVMCVCVMYKKI